MEETPVSRYRKPLYSQPSPIVKAEPWRVFQIIKSTPLGVGAPQGVKFDIKHDLSVGIKHGGEVNLETAYHTSNLVCWKQRLYLPAPFKVFAGPRVPGRRSAATASGQEVAIVKYTGWQGMLGMRCEVEVLEQPTEFASETEIQGECRRQQVMVKRSGVGREYCVSLGPAGQQLLWKGSKKVLDLVYDNAPRCNGNLKLVRPEQPDHILAVYKNRTDPSVLGAILILKDLGRDKFFLEAVLWSCLAIVLAERETGRGWLGGLGKHVV